MISTRDFVTRLTESGLLASQPPELMDALLGLPSAQAAAKELISRNLLTEFQAQVIANDERIPLIIGDYIVQSSLGRGGMGYVLKARHRRMKRDVAIKFLLKELTAADDAKRRFEREVEAAAQLNHQNIVTAYDAGEHTDGSCYLVMQYVDGQDLSHFVKANGPVTISQAVNIISQAAEGLAFAHDQGIVHRDIKPGNLLLDKQGIVRILDMGLARMRPAPGDSIAGGAHADLTNTGSVMGTIDYMAPEQALDAKSADHRADIYSLGCTLWFLLSGNPPYREDTIMRRLLAHREQQIPNVRSVLPQAPSELEEILHRMMAKSKDDRFPSMRHLLVALQGLELDDTESEQIATLDMPDDGSGGFIKLPENESFGRPASRTAPLQLNDSQMRHAKPVSSAISAPPSHPDAATFVASEPSAATDATVTFQADQSQITSAPIKSVEHGSTTSSAPASRHKLAMLAIGGLLLAVIAAFAFRGGKPTDPESDPAKVAAAKPAPDVPATEPNVPITTPVAPFDAAHARAHQEAWARHLGVQVETVNSVGTMMIFIPPGEFLMGTGDDQLAAALKDADDKQHGPEVANQIRNAERPRHRVLLTKPFWMGATEVTLGQFRKFVEATKYQTAAEKHPIGEKPKTYLKPGYDVTDESPVSEVNYEDVVAYCRWLSEKEQATYRLPTEAEWEYACRAGTTTAYSCGDTLLDSHEWSIRNSQVKAQAVATKKPNPFGLFDMHGNVSEWCQDKFDERWYETSPSNDPLNVDPGKHFYVIRGGNWDYNTILRSAYRWAITPDNHAYTIGFRLVRELGVPATMPAKKISPDRHAAEWVIAQGGEVIVNGRQDWVAAVNDLPAGDLEVRLIKFKRRLSGEDADLVPLRELKHLEFLGIDYTHPTAAGITALARLPKLERVSCGGQPLSDEQVTALARLNNVTNLFLAGAQLKPAQCATLAKSMPQIGSLNLMNNSLLDDVAVASLEGLPNLKKLQLQGTKITAVGVAKLRQALPNCDIEWDGASSVTTGVPTTKASPRDVSALQLEPTGRVEIPLTLPTNSAITYEFEVSRKPSESSDVHDQLAILIRGNSLKQYQGKLSWNFNSAPSYSVSSAIPGGERYLVAATAKEQKLRLFINGRQVTEGAPPGPVAISELHGLYLGLSPGAPQAFRAYDAPLHRFRLSRGERYAADYDPSGEWVPDATTLVLYDFRRGGSANQVQDLSGNKHHGRLVGAKWINTTPSATASTDWLDVLPLIDTRLDKLDEPGRTQKNDWQRSSNELVYRSDDFGGRLVLPVRVTGSSLEVEFEVTRTAGTAYFSIELPSAKGTIPVELSREGTTVYVGSPRISIGKYSTKPGQRIRYLCQLVKRDQQDVIDVFADGVSIGHWEGNRDTLATPPLANVAHATSIGFFLAPKTDWTIHRIRVRAPGGLVDSSRVATSPWTDWLGPKLKQGKFLSHFDGRQGWQQEGEAITTVNTISGQEVIRGKTRDGAVRLTYLRRDSKGVQINACDRTTNGKRDLYVAEDHGTQISITMIRAGMPKVLVKEPIPASIPRDAQRTLEFRIVGDTLTATLNGSVVATVKEASLTEGNFALVALKGVLIQKVEYQAPDRTGTDLLQKIDIARDGIGSSWKMTNGTLQTIAGPGEGDRRLYLPIENAPNEYNIRMKVQRASPRDNALMLGMVTGGRRVGLVMDGFKSRGGLWGLEQIDGKGPLDNGTAVPNETLKPDVAADVLVQVRKTGIRVERDGKQLINWVGSHEKLSLNAKWDDKGPPRFFLGAQGDFTIHRLTFEPVQSSETAWSELFNGKDLAGWEVMGVKGWSVENGVLLGNTSGSAGNGWLMSERQFGDFELELDYKLSPGSNSGIFLRAWPEGPVDGSQFREIQLLDDDDPKFASLPAKNRTGSLFGMVAPSVVPKVPADQWHRVRVHLKGQQLRLSINDVAVLDHTLSDLRPSGRIGLQIYPNRVEFRNVRVRPID